jgi:predicted Zn-dependent protease
LPRDFKLFYGEKVSDEISEHVERHLNDLYGIHFRSVGLRLPSKTAWDAASNSFDAKTLIRNLNSDSINFCMWLIAQPLVLDGKSVFGYAEPLNGAIISSIKMATRTLIAKEVAYFVGIVLGLTNCPNDCVMSETDSFERLVQKSSALCNTCNIRFQKLKFRYM